MKNLFATLAALALCLDVHADEPSLVGTWKGPWYLGMSSGPAELVVTGDGGTLLLTNHETFGSAPVPLSEVSDKEGLLSFRARGADGRWLEARLPLDASRQTLKGAASHAGYKLRLELKRTQ